MPPDVPNIFEAAATDDVDALEIALQYYDVNVKDENDMTPLHHAAGKFSFKAAARLLEEPDIDVTCVDKFGREAAIMAEEVSWIGNSEAARMRDMIWSDPEEEPDQDLSDNDFRM